MNTHADQTQENKSQLVASGAAQKLGSGESTFQFVDNRPEAVAKRKLQEMANNSPQVKQLRAFQEMANNSQQAKQTVQLQSMINSRYTSPIQKQGIDEEEPIQQKKETAVTQFTDGALKPPPQDNPIQKKASPEHSRRENNTGLPDNLKTGMKNLSGMSLDDVKVHRNSDKPAQLQAHAYAKGTDIHLGPGQEKHLPHEAWQVVQQKQGRVKPTMQMKGKVNVNDDAGLEKEADVMGSKAANYLDNQSNSGIENLSGYSKNHVKEVVQRNIDTRLSTKQGRKEGTSASSKVNVLIEDYNRIATIFASEKLQDLREEQRQEMKFILQNILKGLKGVNSSKRAQAEKIFDEIEIELIIMKHPGSVPGAESTDKYAMFDEVKAHAVEKIAKSEDTDLDEVLNYLTMARRKVALGQHADAADQFGAPRPNEPRFKDMEENLANIHDMKEHTKIGGSGGGMGMFRTPGMKDDGTPVYGSVELAAMRARMQGMKGQNPPAHFTYSTTDDPATIRDDTAAKEMYRVQDEEGLKLTATVFAKDNTVEYWHSTPTAIQAALQKAGAHHTALMKSTTTEDGLRELGKVTWYLTNAMPYLRGSAAISEWYNEAMNLKKELGLGQRQGKIDLVAFRTDQQTYADTYKAIWENTPPNALPTPTPLPS